MLLIDYQLKAEDLLAPIRDLWRIAGPKISLWSRLADEGRAAPVFTVNGEYQSQGWTEWTQGFQFGSALLQFDATDDAQYLDLGRRQTRAKMSAHVTHFGVHDHGFHIVSTYGHLWRLMNEGRTESSDAERRFYELALQASASVQAARWSHTAAEDGYIYSFNGPHSLFSDTMRSLRSLALGHQLGHAIREENDARISLLDRLIQHARTTARYNVYYGQGRDTYDVRGRVAHESIFNVNDGNYRCPSTQQGYSPFSTWTRGLAWIMLGYSEQLEFLSELSDDQLASCGGRASIEQFMLEAALASCDFYLQNTPTDGIPYWDTGAPGLPLLGDYLNRPADPWNDVEPVDSSAAAIACQGLLRLGRYLGNADPDAAATFWQAGLTVLRALLREPYLAADPRHQGLLLHAVYHRPRGWDHVPAGARTPRGEACLWGDYHLLEVALYVQRIARMEKYYSFFG